jgi:prepilin signal peptidase PulO-like enzyme (type II secretory pathway)
LGAALILQLPERNEPDYRTQLPVWIKLPAIAGVVLFLILVRNTLQGFATVFPMVGVIAAYESRYCLWTIGRQIPVIMVSLGALMAAAYLVQSFGSLPLALVAGWAVFLLVFGGITFWMWSRGPAPAGSFERSGT